MKPYYQDENCTIYHGDCRDILPDLPKVDLVLTDPPYELDKRESGKSSLKSLQKFNSEELHKISDGFDINILSDINCNPFNMFCFCSNKQISRIMATGEDLGYSTNLLIWYKNNAAPFANGVWKNDIEFCIHMKESGAYFEGNSRIKSKVFTHPIVTDKSHPTVKPLDLIKKYIMIGSDESHLILDPFMGSGTTLRAAKDLNRHCIGIEMEEKYCEIAVKRLSQEVMKF